MNSGVIDPELQAQLKKSLPTEPVEATITLDPGANRKFIPSEDVAAQVKAILCEVGEDVGESHEDLNVFANLGSFVVRARPAFLKALVKRPEVASAMANRQTRELLIPPVRKGPTPKK